MELPRGPGVRCLHFREPGGIMNLPKMQQAVVTFYDHIRWRTIRRRMRNRWLYAIFLVVIVLPMLAMAASIAVRSHMFALAGRPPKDQQIKIFLTFVSGGLATAVTFVGLLLTSHHNARERRRLQLEAVLKSLDSLPRSQVVERVCAAFPAMVLLGQQRVALRALNPAIVAESMDMATATWVIDQVLNSGKQVDPLDDRPIDSPAVNEAAVILFHHAKANRLTQCDPAEVYFPGNLFEDWNRDLPHDAKEHILLAMAYTLVQREKDWWTRKWAKLEDGLPRFPTRAWVKCAKTEFDPQISKCAAVLLKALLGILSEDGGASGAKQDARNMSKAEARPSVEMSEGLAKEVGGVLKKRKFRSLTADDVREPYRKLAIDIQRKWRAKNS